MTNILKQPYTKAEYAQFASEANSNGQRTERHGDFVYQLYPDETVEDGEIVKNPEYENEIIVKNKTWFEDNFFNTSLGWIRRNVHTKDGEVKFLSGMLPLITKQVENATDEGLVQITPILVRYKYPDSFMDMSETYLKTLEVRSVLSREAVTQFITECELRQIYDFTNA